MIPLFWRKNKLSLETQIDCIKTVLDDVHGEVGKIKTIVPQIPGFQSRLHKLENTVKDMTEKVNSVLHPMSLRISALEGSIEKTEALINMYERKLKTKRNAKKD